MFKKDLYENLSPLQVANLERRLTTAGFTQGLEECSCGACGQEEVWNSPPTWTEEEEDSFLFGSDGNFRSELLSHSYGYLCEGGIQCNHGSESTHWVESEPEHAPHPKK